MAYSVHMLYEVLDVLSSTYYYQQQELGELDLREAVEYLRYGSWRSCVGTDGKSTATVWRIFPC